MRPVLASIDWDRSELLKLVTNSVGPTQLLSLGGVGTVCKANLLELGTPAPTKIKYYDRKRLDAAPEQMAAKVYFDGNTCLVASGRL